MLIPPEESKRRVQVKMRGDLSDIKIWDKYCPKSDNWNYYWMSSPRRRMRRGYNSGSSTLTFKMWSKEKEPIKEMEKKDTRSSRRTKKELSQ